MSGINGVGPNGPQRPKADPFVGSGLNEVTGKKGFEGFGKSEPIRGVMTGEIPDKFEMSELVDKADAAAAEHTAMGRVQTVLIRDHNVDVSKVSDSTLIALAKTLMTSDVSRTKIFKIIPVPGTAIRHVNWNKMPESQEFGTHAEIVNKLSVSTSKMEFGVFTSELARTMPKNKNKSDGGSSSGGSGKHLSWNDVKQRYPQYTSRFYSEALTPKLGEGVVGGVENFAASLMGVNPNSSAAMMMGANVIPFSMPVGAMTFA